MTVHSEDFYARDLALKLYDIDDCDSFAFRNERYERLPHGAVNLQRHDGVTVASINEVRHAHAECARRRLDSVASAG